MIGQRLILRRFFQRRKGKDVNCEIESHLKSGEEEDTGILEENWRR